MILSRDVKKFKNAVVYPDIAILRFDADLYFANSGSRQHRFHRNYRLRVVDVLVPQQSGRFREKMVTFARNHSIVILDASLMTSIDLQASETTQWPTLLKMLNQR